MRGYAAFTMRNIANNAGVHGSNLYYYFPGKLALIQGLVSQVLDSHAKQLDEISALQDLSKGGRFLNLIDVMISEIKQPNQCRFYTQLWALLTSGSKISNTIMESFFNSYRERIYKLIQPICPDANPLDLNRRAAIISSIIEGARVTVSSEITKSTDLKDFDNGIRRMVIKVARNGI